MVQQRVRNRLLASQKLLPNGLLNDKFPHAAAIFVNDSAGLLVVAAANSSGCSWDAACTAIYCFAAALGHSGDFAPDVAEAVAQAAANNQALRPHEVLELEAARDHPFLSYASGVFSRCYFDKRIQTALQVEEAAVRSSSADDAARRVPLQVEMIQ